MRGDGQRQDVGFLALAVAVLAVAVALFVGMRMQRQNAEKPKPEPVQQAEAPKPVVTVPEKTDSTRDPFKTQAGSASSAAQSAPARATAELKLVGIVRESGDSPMAIIRTKTRRYYASVGGRAAGYSVVDIGDEKVTLEKDGNRITLVLREPEPAED
jgi:hypothetical protein